jgi:hypothetical protein
MSSVTARRQCPFGVKIMLLYLLIRRFKFMEVAVEVKTMPEIEAARPKAKRTVSESCGKLAFSTEI